MPLCYLYETTGTDENGDPVAIRVTTGRGYSHPSAPGFFEGRTQANGDSGVGLTVERTVFAGEAFGGGDISYGTMKILNPAGDLDDWIDLGFGQPATLKLGEESGPYSDFTTVLTARCASLTVADTFLSLVWEGRLAELDQPACPANFLGNNSGFTGLEGTENDIKGTNKPWAMGVIPRLTPVLLNSSTRIYGWNWDADGDRAATHSIDGVYFNGAAWDFDADYADAEDLAASTPINGHYTTCKAESLIKMGGSVALNGRITVSVTIESTTSARYAGNLWKAALLRAGVTSGDISAADVTALNTAAPYAAGYYAQGETFRQVADAMAASVAACYVPDRLGVYRIRQMTAPSGSPIADFTRLQLGVAQGLTTGDLISIAPLSGAASLPAKEIKVRYARNWTPMSPNEVASSVSAEDQAFVTAEWRTTAPAQDADIADRYGNAKSRTYDTYLATETGANAIRDVLLALFAAQRRLYRATVTYGPAFAALLDLGAVVKVTHPKFALDAGKLARIHGIRLRQDTQIAELTLWL